MSLALAVNVLDIQDTMTTSNESALNSRYIFSRSENLLNRPRNVLEGMVFSLIQMHPFVIFFTIASMAKLSKLRVPPDYISTSIAEHAFGPTALVEK